MREPSPRLKNKGYGRAERRRPVETPPASDKQERSNRAREPPVLLRMLRSRSTARNACCAPVSAVPLLAILNLTTLSERKSGCVSNNNLAFHMRNTRLAIASSARLQSDP